MLDSWFDAGRSASALDNLAYAPGERLSALLLTRSPNGCSAIVERAMQCAVYEAQFIPLLEDLLPPKPEPLS